MERSLGIEKEVIKIGLASREDLKLRAKWSIVELFEEVVAKHGERIGLMMINGENCESFSFEEIDQRSNQGREQTYGKVPKFWLTLIVANWAISQGFICGEVAALMMENRPEFLWTWLGFAKIGVVTALINTNLKGRALLESVALVRAKYYFIGAHTFIKIACLSKKLLGHEFKDSFGLGFTGHTELKGQWFTCGGVIEGMTQVDHELTNASSSNFGHAAMRASVKSDDDLFYIYTRWTKFPNNIVNSM